MWSFRPLSIAMMKIIRWICPVPLQDALYGENTDHYFGGFCSGLAERSVCTALYERSYNDT